MLYTNNSVYRPSPAQTTNNVSTEPLSYFSTATYPAPLINQSEFCVPTNTIDCGNTINNSVMLINGNYFPATTSTNYNNYNNWSSSFSNLSSNRLVSISPEQNFNISCINKTVESGFEDKENLPLNNVTDILPLSNESKKEIFANKNSIYSSTASATILENKNVLKPSNLQPNFNVSSSSTSSRKEFNSDIEEIRYRERRQKNNEAAKQSRSKRRDRENLLKEKVDALEAENKLLKVEINQLRLELIKNSN